MIGALVTFPNPRPRSVAEATAEWEKTAPAYETQPGFIRKHYLMTGDSATIGGFYLWESRTDADRFYSDTWHTRITAYAGQEPQVTYFDIPAVIEAAVTA